MNKRWRIAQLLLLLCILVIPLVGVMYMAYILCGDGCAVPAFVLMTISLVLFGCLGAACVKIMIEQCGYLTESGTDV